jgi:UDP-N-acetylmuramoylalanine--D-glutamate ligase
MSFETSHQRAGDRLPKGGRVLVLGAGESGISAARLLHSEGHDVTLADFQLHPAHTNEGLREIASSGVRVVFGADCIRADDLSSFAYGVVSPGVDSTVGPVRSLVAGGLTLVSEIELAWLRAQRPCVAVTGTNGKTTTTQIIELMLNACGKRTRASGNIGPSFSRQILSGEALDYDTLEVSSFQLETIHRFHPKGVVWTNFAEDHLDRYPDMGAYRRAKLRIFENLTEEDFAVVNLRDALPELRCEKITFSAYVGGGDFDLKDGAIRYRGEKLLEASRIRLRGAHNIENMMAALGVGLGLGLDLSACAEAIATYCPQPHRCELIATVNDVEYVNDSKATNLDSVEKALLSEVRPVVLIAGGKDKGFGFGPLTGLVAARCRAAVLIGEMAARIRDEWAPSVDCHLSGSLPEAVSLASRLSSPGDVVLLSPGTSSFDMFKNYAQRGEVFREEVRKLGELASAEQQDCQPLRNV